MRISKLVVVVIISFIPKIKHRHLHAIIVTNNPGPCSLAGTWQDGIKTVNKQYWTTEETYFLQHGKLSARNI